MIEDKNSERGREGRRLIRYFKRGCRNSADTNASAHTPKAGVGQSSIGSISQKDENVKNKKWQHISQKFDVQAPNQTSDNELSMNAVEDSISPIGKNVKKKHQSCVQSLSSRNAAFGRIGLVWDKYIIKSLESQ